MSYCRKKSGLHVCRVFVHLKVLHKQQCINQTVTQVKQSNRVKTAAAKMSVCHVSAPCTLPAQTTELGLPPVAFVCTAGLSLYRRRLACRELTQHTAHRDPRAWLVSLVPPGQKSLCPVEALLHKLLPQGKDFLVTLSHEQRQEEGRMPWRAWRCKGRTRVKVKWCKIKVSWHKITTVKK